MTGRVKAVALGLCALASCSERGPVLALCSPDAPYAMALAANVEIRHNDVWGVDESGDVHRLTRDHASSQPSFSPDGESIAFVSGRDGGWEECCGFDHLEIWVMDATGEDQRPLTEGPGDADPAWSPDGRTIAFTRGKFANDAGAIYTMAPDGDDLRRVTDPPSGQVDSRPSWSPEGDLLAFVRGNGGEAQLWTVGRDGSDPRRVEGADPDGYEEIAWSPDGERIAYVDDGATNLIDPEGGEPTRVESTSIAPTWLPDGRLAYFDRRQDEQGEWSLWQLTVWDEGDETDVPIEPFSFVSPDYTPDWPDCPNR